MVLDMCPNSYSSILPCSWMVRLDSSLKIIKFSSFLRSSRIDFVYEPVALHLSGLHCEQLLQF